MHLKSFFGPLTGKGLQACTSSIPASEQTGMPRTRAPVAALVVISVNKDYLSESSLASLPASPCEGLLQSNS